MTDLSTLLSRVESGSGADRATDIEIQIALVGDAVWPARDMRGRITNPNSRMSDYLETYRDTINDDDQDFDFPRYTTDLNAVVALVEARLPGWRWMVRRMEPQPGAPSQYAAYVQNTEDGLYHWRAASIAARALLAALIRAEMETHSEP